MKQVSVINIDDPVGRRRPPNPLCTETFTIQRANDWQKALPVRLMPRGVLRFKRHEEELASRTPTPQDLANLCRHLSDSGNWLNVTPRAGVWRWMKPRRQSGIDKWLTLGTLKGNSISEAQAQGSPTVGFSTTSAVAFTARVSTSFALLPGLTGGCAMPR